MNEEKKSIVVIGGGTGTHTILTGLKHYTDRVKLTAIVTTADSGGSTGRLRDEFGYLPVGDVRMALSALAEGDTEHADVLRKLFLYRFSRGEGLSGHTLGNLLLVALAEIMGDEERAIHAASRVLRTCGEVLPVTTTPTVLRAEYSTGRVAEGEHAIDCSEGGRGDECVTELMLTTPTRASARALEALRSADVIILGPGDLYTSILANCVVGGVPEAICASRAKLMYVANLMSRSGQTGGMGTGEYIGELRKYIGRAPDTMLVNTTPLRADLLVRYEGKEEYPVAHTYQGGDTKVVSGDFAAEEDIVLAKGDVVKRSLIRHDPHKLARGIMELLFTPLEGSKNNVH